MPEPLPTAQVNAELAAMAETVAALREDLARSEAASASPDRWVASSDHGTDFDSEEYPSREEAVARFPRDRGLATGERFWTGLAARPKAGNFVAGVDIIERLQEAAYDSNGEWAEDWLSDVLREDEEALDLALAEVVNRWAAERGHRPAFFDVIEVQEHTVPDPEEGS